MEVHVGPKCDGTPSCQWPKEHTLYINQLAAACHPQQLFLLLLAAARTSAGDHWVPSCLRCRCARLLRRVPILCLHQLLELPPHAAHKLAEGAAGVELRQQLRHACHWWLAGLHCSRRRHRAEQGRAGRAECRVACGTALPSVVEGLAGYLVPGSNPRRGMGGRTVPRCLPYGIINQNDSQLCAAPA